MTPGSSCFSRQGSRLDRSLKMTGVFLSARLLLAHSGRAGRQMSRQLLGAKRTFRHHPWGLDFPSGAAHLTRRHERRTTHPAELCLLVVPKDVSGTYRATADAWRTAERRRQVVLALLRALPTPRSVRVRCRRDPMGAGRFKRCLTAAGALHGMRSQRRDDQASKLVRQQHRLHAVSC
jgi:hypothetical protein